MHKSIFARIEEYYSNPIREYLKISSFVENTYCSFSDTFRESFSKLFSSCVPLRKIYISYSDCVYKNIGLLPHYTYEIDNDTYDSFESDIKEQILDSFLTYMEIISCMLCILMKHGGSLYGSSSLDRNSINQLDEMIDTSLKSINHRITSKSVDGVKIIKTDPISEYVAEQSPKDIKTAILNYLSIRQVDVDGKKKHYTI